MQHTRHVQLNLALLRSLAVALRTLCSAEPRLKITGMKVCNRVADVLLKESLTDKVGVNERTYSLRTYIFVCLETLSDNACNAWSLHTYTVFVDAKNTCRRLASARKLPRKVRNKRTGVVLLKYLWAWEMRRRDDKGTKGPERGVEARSAKVPRGWDLRGALRNCMFSCIFAFLLAAPAQ